MLSDPDKFVSPPKAQLPWSYFVFTEDRRLMEDGLDFSLQMDQAGPSKRQFIFIKIV